MSISDTSELKRLLRAEGFEIYRTLGKQVLLAERVRDNLIMDSGVAAELGEHSLEIQVTLKSQASHFPGADVEQLRAHAHRLADSFLAAGYNEEEAVSRRVADPSDPELTLDTSHEVRLKRRVDSEEALFEGLRDALSHRRSTGED